jgi:hypothetical protein
LEISGFVEERVDSYPPEFPLSPDLPRSFRNLVRFASRPQHLPPPYPGHQAGPARTRGDQRQIAAPAVSRRPGRARAEPARPLSSGPGGASCRPVPSAPPVPSRRGRRAGALNFCGEVPGFGEAEGYRGTPDLPRSPYPPRYSRRPGEARVPAGTSMPLPAPAPSVRGEPAAVPASPGPLPPAGLTDPTRSPARTVSRLTTSPSRPRSSARGQGGRLQGWHGPI